MKKTPKIIIIVLIVVVIIIAFWLTSRKSSEPATNIETQQAGLGAQVFDEVGKDPVKGKIPDLNPLSAGVNPYSNAYKNPFSQ